MRLNRCIGLLAIGDERVGLNSVDDRKTVVKWLDCATRMTVIK